MIVARKTIKWVIWGMYFRDNLFYALRSRYQNRAEKTSSVFSLKKVYFSRVRFLKHHSHRRFSQTKFESHQETLRLRIIPINWKKKLASQECCWRFTQAKSKRPSVLLVSHHLLPAVNVTNTLLTFNNKPKRPCNCETDQIDGVGLEKVVIDPSD